MLWLFRKLFRNWRAGRNTRTADPDGGVQADGLSEPTIHIHEDDWSMRNVYPVEALPDVTSDVAKSAAAGERNRAPDGVGWTDVHVIEPPDIDYLAVELSLAGVASALEAIMPRIRRFNATATAGFDAKVRDPWGTYEEDAYCFGFDRDCFLKLEPVGDRIKFIWFECRTKEPERLAALRQALVALDGFAPSTLADYWLNVAGAIHDSAFLDRYFQALAGHEPAGEKLAGEKSAGDNA
jgi:hypothetical protein